MEAYADRLASDRRKWPLDNTESLADRVTRLDD